MDKQLINFGKRMDAAQDKKVLISYCEGAKRVLDLGAGTGAMAREIAEKYGCHVDAVDQDWKSDNLDTCEGKVNYIQSSIKEFIYEFHSSKKYDRIILSGIIHELDFNTIDVIHRGLYRMMAKNCRILIREPFWDSSLTMLKDEEKFARLVAGNVSALKTIEYEKTEKLSTRAIFRHDNLSPLSTCLFWLNLAFVISYGKDSWEREKHEYRYAYDLKWCKCIFDFPKRSYTGFQVFPVLDTTYRQHFINAGIPGEAFDLIGYTGMHVIIDYSR